MERKTHIILLFHVERWGVVFLLDCPESQGRDGDGVFQKCAGTKLSVRHFQEQLANRKNEDMKIEGQIVDPKQRKIFPGSVHMKDGKIVRIEKQAKAPSRFIMPGFVDAHVHIESSMVLPSRFAEVAVGHGTLATVSDPHEIANVMGREGVDFMINDGSRVPFRFYFGAPSCVPATPFDNSGAVLGPKETEDLLQRDDIWFLSEMMNFPGVINRQADVMEKLALARKHNKPIDGHAPGLRGDGLERYLEEGISTDHESFSLEEAREKIKGGMKIQIREGSAAKNFEALHPLIDEYPDKVMFCMDDCHPDDLMLGHINRIVQKALEKGHDFFNVLRAAGYTTKNHYGLDVGMLQEGDNADFIVVENLEDFALQEAWIDGKVVYAKGGIAWERPLPVSINKFVRREIKEQDIQIKIKNKAKSINVIQAIDGELITQSFQHPIEQTKGFFNALPGKDILKIVVVNRYEQRPPAVGFIRGFGLKKGAIAGSIAHDSHNLIAVGVNDEAIVAALNTLMETGGGIVVAKDEKQYTLPLPVAGLMSTDQVSMVANKHQDLDRLAHEMGCQLKAPFMTLAFMSLLVIPELKIGDAGLFDVNQFQYISLFST